MFISRLFYRYNFLFDAFQSAECMCIYQVLEMNTHAPPYYIFSCATSTALNVYLVVWFTTYQNKTIKPKRGFTDWRLDLNVKSMNLTDTFMTGRNVICNYDVDDADGDGAEDDDKMCSTIK